LRERECVRESVCVPMQVGDVALLRAVLPSFPHPGAGGGGKRVAIVVLPQVR